MKNLGLTLLVSFLFALTSHAQAEEGDFFIGKWKLMGYGLPQGDTEMIFIIKKNDDGKLSGQVGETEEVIPFTKVETEVDKMTVYYDAQGFEVYTILEKVDQDSVKGTIMDMFDVDGKRVKE